MNFLYAALASIIFSFVDYLGYNELGRKGPTQLIVYRIIQTVIQLCLVYALWCINPWAAVAFVIIWWTFLCDFLYYAFCNMGLFGITGAAFTNEVMGNQVTWAWWTPYGLFKWATTRVRNSVIDGSTLILQGALGLFVALAITRVI